VKRTIIINTSKNKGECKKVTPHKYSPTKRFGENNICEDKTPDMKVFNGICFNDYTIIKDNFREMAENNIKLNVKEGVTLSVYSYNDYFNNFDKIVEENSKSTIIDLRECLSLYKKQNNINEETDIYIVVVILLQCIQMKQLIDLISNYILII
jgi:hypothetical protein